MSNDACVLTGRTRHVWRAFGILGKVTVRVFQVEKSWPSAASDSFGTASPSGIGWFDATPDDTGRLREMEVSREQ